MKTTEEMRVDFEAWATAQALITERTHGVCSFYVNPHTAMTWQAWKAATWQPEAEEIAKHWAKGMELQSRRQTVIPYLDAYLASERLRALNERADKWKAPVREKYPGHPWKL